MNNEDLEKLRGLYQNEALDTLQAPDSPYELFDKWLESAVQSQCIEPNAFVLSTIYEGRPRSRVVLLKGVDEGKLIFYTNYRSAKGKEIEKDQFVAINFWWGPIGRQIRVEGKIEKVSEETSNIYFQKRPRGSQLGAIASPQSEVVSSREELEGFFAKTLETYEKVEVIPRPEHWGGYAVTPTYFEFWQGRNNRLHDRVNYRKSNNGWDINRLAP